jgi:hypothetical protein
LIRRALCFATIAISFVIHAASAGAQPGSALELSAAVPAGLPPVPAPASTIASPAVERAIALGRKKKDGNHALVLRDAGQGFANAMAVLAAPRWQAPATKSGLWLEIYTPLTWIAQQAANATREYRDFVLTEDMVAPIVRVYAHPDTPDIVSARGAAGTRSVQRVVMQNRRRTVTVQPLSSDDFTVEAKNAVGGSLTYSGQVVTFALDDVLRIFGEGEFDVIVVGSTGEKRYTVKAKHFKRLPM